jgi:hypothetical protein
MSTMQRWGSWGGRAGLIGLAFFTLKGLVWLGLAAVAAMGVVSV